MTQQNSKKLWLLQIGFAYGLCVLCSVIRGKLTLNRLVCIKYSFNSCKEMQWDPLPPRKKRGKPSPAGESSELKISDEKVSSIDGIIRARSEVTRALATLEGKDGCAGEFYECTSNLSTRTINFHCKIQAFFSTIILDLDHTADVQFHTW